MLRFLAQCRWARSAAVWPECCAPWQCCCTLTVSERCLYPSLAVQAALHGQSPNSAARFDLVHSYKRAAQ